LAAKTKGSNTERSETCHQDLSGTVSKNTSCWHEYLYYLTLEKQFWMEKTPKNAGGWKMIFLFNLGVFLGSMLIFWGVVYMTT